MHLIKLIIQYDGTRYCGWQAQAVRKKSSHNRRLKPSIQQTIENALAILLKGRVKLTASGRTDSGVHAFSQAAHFKTASFLGPDKLQRALNALLPADIQIANAQYSPSDFHARYSTKSKCYRYFILNQRHRSVFLQRYAYRCKFRLSVSAMRRASRFLVGRHDFKSFCARGSNVNSTVRKIYKISIKEELLFATKIICIEIEADGFLYNMVRNIVGTLIEVGRGRFKPRDITVILKNKDRAGAGPCVPAKGLF